MAQINNTTSYPEATAPLSSDSILIGSLASGVTNNFQLSDIATFVMGANTLTLQDVCDQGSSTTTDITVGGVAYLARLSVSSVASFSYVDVSAAFTSSSTANIADTLTLSKATGRGLDVTADATVGGALGVTGASTFTGVIDANSTADIADTLTLSKVTGTGLQVDANANISGDLNVISDVSVGDRLAVTGFATMSGGLRLTAAAPATATSTGIPNTIAVDTTHIYVCTATNTWKRVAIATW